MSDQAPVMSREEWSYRIDLIITWATNGFSLSDVSKRKADVLDAIMSLQAEVERLRKRKEDDDYTITVECGGKSLRVIAGKAIIDRARSPEKLADTYVKSVVGETLEDVFRIKQINDENNAMRIALNHLAQPGNMAARTLEAIEKARRPT